MKKLWFGLFALCLLNMSQAVAQEKVLVFAASSLTNALSELAESYEDASGDDIVLSFASSSTLARQLAQGAPADLYLSANTKWMDYAAEQQVINSESRKDLLHNRLVLVTHQSESVDSVALDSSWNISKALMGSRLAVGDPNHVPAGIYAQEALTSLGLWQQAEPLLARANNVRAALLLVERQEAKFGIVYQTDAQVAKNVKVVAHFPEQSHQPITYPVALTQQTPSKSAQGFYDYLQTSDAAEVFQRYGFSVNEPRGSVSF
ncbi:MULTISPECIES: molybdate ABC transporter substrate-binding protein [Photobacterium]|uniref:Molybdenum ABC transporter substrate-binding protein n=1 Tax=Photobacterium halotolerans TaxID=265726 RepID=A0A0F5VBS9_9GAMM|nr:MULTISPECIES: molybdate ABC transporter substrate-binding protein [Photobacterium]KKC99563.1 molybdenum ABC transporter substrate-binding protein [Photobacterium halotolerans]UIP29847.1 molybdate ABC transporter substrate-binding protein [Photobacterium sp. TLY01]